MSGYVEIPAGWERVASEGPGPFVTAETFRTPDGRLVRWRSRAHRKSSPAIHRAAAGTHRSEPVWWRPRRRAWWMAVLFSIGSSCFLVGGVVSQWQSTTHEWVGPLFFAGSIFFTSASYLQYNEAVNAERGLEGERLKHRWRPASWEPKRIDWLAALIQFIGTLFFNVTTFASMKTGFDTHQYNVRVWSPDALGCVAFLVSSELAYAEVCHRWFSLRDRTLGWWITALNMLGSIAFGLSAIAALAAPSTGMPLSVHLANAGTSVGGLCFLIASVAMIPEAAREEREALAAPAAAPAPAPG